MLLVGSDDGFVVSGLLTGLRQGNAEVRLLSMKQLMAVPYEGKARFGSGLVAALSSRSQAHTSDDRLLRRHWRLLMVDNVVESRSSD